MTAEFEQRWLSDLQPDWTERRADFLCNPYRVTVDPEIFGDDLVAHYSIPQVQKTGGPFIEPASDIGSTKLLVTAPTLLVSKLNPRKKTICIAEPHPEYPTLASGEFVAIISDQMDRRYAYYLWCSEKVTDRLSAIVQSATRSHQRVNPADIQKLPWKWPPLDMQRRIADFLDEKTSRIDGLIEKKRDLLDRLAEKRQALITRAVTRGLDPDAPMKPSGIDWLGDIPAHWKRIRLRWLSRRYAGGTPNTKNPEYWDGGTIPWLKSGAVNQGTITEPSDHITELALKESSAKWIPKGALVMALAGQGKTKATVGFLGIRTTGNQSLAAIVPEKIDGKYLYWWLSSQYLTLRNLSSQDGRDGLNLDMIGSVVCPVPPLDTQRRIADFLDEKTARIDETAKQVLRSIEYLSEYRSALITAAVTGQLAAAQTADLGNLSPQGD